jgi:4-hydroxymandelate oxidase
VKGVLTPEDARLAMDAGVAGIIVSNHGGRQLDGAEPTLRALPRVAEAVGGAVPVLMDGGIRRGVDVLKALALGARAVMIGRAYLWGLAVGGEPGVKHVLELLRTELELAMVLSGRPAVASIDRSLVTEG